MQPRAAGPLGEPTWSRLDLALLAAGLVLVALSYGPHLGHSSDDAFITYRYARNLAAGHGLVFNVGQQHLGTTAPGWAVVLGGVAVLSGPQLVPLMSGLLSLTALIWAAWLACRRLLGHGPRLFVITVWLLAPNRWLIEVLGHEGFAQAALALAALDLLERARPARSGLVWAAAAFVRPDAGVMGAVAGVDEWLRRRRLPLHLLVGFAASAGVVALVQWALAGSVVPVSLRVKLAEASVPALAVVPGYWARLATWFWRCWGWGGPLLLALSVVGWGWMLRDRRPRAVRILAPTAAIFLFYPLLGVNFAPWYLVLPVLMVTVGAAAAVAVPGQLGRRRLAAVAAALAAASVSVPAQWAAHSAGEVPDTRARPMLSAARWIEARSDPDDSVAALEVGFLGFHCRRPILDLIGLCSPEALEAVSSGRLPEFFLAQRPAFLVYNTAFAYLLDPVVGDPRFRQAYRLVRTIPPSRRHVTEVQIWQRQSAPERPPTAE